jgi:hypothetical protein
MLGFFFLFDIFFYDWFVLFGNNLIVLGAQDLWILMLCRSFFTPGREIGSAVFMVWVLVQSGMLSCDSTVNTD